MGELEFVLPDEKVVRLHGTEWARRSVFTIILMLTGGGGVADERNCVWCFTPATGFDCHAHGENKWLTREQTSGIQQQIRRLCRRCRCRLTDWKNSITAVGVA